MVQEEELHVQHRSSGDEGGQVPHQCHHDHQTSDRCHGHHRGTG